MPEFATWQPKLSRSPEKVFSGLSRGQPKTRCPRDLARKFPEIPESLGKIFEGLTIRCPVTISRRDLPVPNPM